MIIVTGPGRSGTSAVARVLHESGVRMGNELAPPTEFNERGFYEEEPVRAVNDKILADVGMETVEYWAGRDKIMRAAQQYHDEMSRLASGAGGGWKDPRFAITLEAWLPHLAEPPKIVLCLRSPEAFVHSVMNIFGLYEPDVLERWWANHLRRPLDIVREYGLEATSVVYEELITEPAAVVARLASFAGHELDASFVEPELRRFTQPVPERHAALYDEVRALASV